MSPMAPPRPCAQPGCPKLVTTGSRCPEHQRALWKSQDISRPSPSARGYGRAWQKLRQQILARDGGVCTVPGCGEAATEVDHVIPKHAGGTDAPENLASTCRRHHATKTGTERQRLSMRDRP